MVLKVDDIICFIKKKFLQNIGIFLYLLIIFIIVILLMSVRTNVVYAKDKDEYSKNIQEEFRNFDPTNKSAKKIKIVFWHNISGPETKILEEIIKKFESKYPQIEVQHMSKGNWPQLYNNINSILITDNYPNLAFCYLEHLLSYNYSNKLLSFDDLIKAEESQNRNFLFKDIYDILIKQTKISFEPNKTPLQIYSLPFFKTKEVFYYNKTYFRDNKTKLQEIFGSNEEEKKRYDNYFADNVVVDSLIPFNWQHIEKISKIIKEIECEKGHNVIPIIYESIHNLFFNYAINTNKPIKISETDIQKDDNNFFKRDDIKEIIKYFKDKLIDKDFLTNKTLIGFKDYVSLFLEEESYMLIDSSRRQIINQSPKFTLGIAPIPVPVRDADGKKYINEYKTLHQGPNICLFYKKNIKEVLASWFFIKYLLLDEQVSMLLLEKGMFPSNKKFVEQYLDKEKNNLTKMSLSKQLEYNLIKLIDKEFVDDKTFSLNFFNKADIFRQSLGYFLFDYFFIDKNIDSKDKEEKINNLYSFYYRYLISSE